jgi:hypothetical protein
VNCARCGHRLADHCEGDQRHAHYKDEMRMAKTPRVYVCTTRHCLQPLCTCIDFVEAA